MAVSRAGSPPICERSRGIARADALLFGATLFVIALLALTGESLARRAEAGSAAPGAFAALHRYSDTLGWEPRPGAILRLPDRVVSINENGHRGRAYPRPKAADVTRVVVLGDSVTFGLDVGDHATFAMRLDDARPDWEVVNLGVQGYGTDQELLLLERDGLAYAPDVVVLNLCVGNDFVDNALPHFLYDARHPKPYFEIEGGQLRLRSAQLRLGPGQRVARALLERSALFRRLVPLRDGAGGGRHWVRWVSDVETDPAPAVELTARLLERVVTTAGAAGAATLIAAHPHHRLWREGYPMLDALTQRLGVPRSPALWLDLADAYRARGEDFDALTLDKVGHLDDRGHRVVAEILEETIESLLQR